MGQDNHHNDKAPELPGWREAALRNIMRLLMIIGIVWLMHGALVWLTAQIGTLNSIGGNTTVPVLMIGFLIAYALLIAIPFMPGIEVGAALLLLQGAAIAPFVYLATVGGLLIAYAVGRTLPLDWLHAIFRDLRMTRACRLIETIKITPPADRLAAMQDRLPGPVAKVTVNFRYVMIAALINMPGTVVIGGGGGILMLAGITRLFSAGYVVLTVLIATLPVPLAVWLFGAKWLF